MTELQIKKSNKATMKRQEQNNLDLKVAFELKLANLRKHQNLKFVKTRN